MTCATSNTSRPAVRCGDQTAGAEGPSTAVGTPTVPIPDFGLVPPPSLPFHPPATQIRAQNRLFFQTLTVMADDNMAGSALAMVCPTCGGPHYAYMCPYTTDQPIADAASGEAAAAMKASTSMATASIVASMSMLDEGDTDMVIQVGG